MEIKLIKRAGVPRAETEAHQLIQREFSGTPFSRGWRGYASFALARGGRGSGDDDLDLVLVTHTTIAIIELKNWNGKVLESNGQKWFLDGEDKGDSAVAVVNRKVPKLVSVMKQKLGLERTPFICAYVVMHGKIGSMKLTEEDGRSVLNMTEFLSLRYEDCYKQYFKGKPKFNPLDYLDGYDKFFQGQSFKPKVYYVDGFRPDSVPIFEHPAKLYREYKAFARDDQNALALLRQWDFTALGLDLIGETDRAFIGLREQRIFEYVSELNEELSLSLLRPISRKGAKDVTLDFAELFALPSKVSRLDGFTHSVLPKLSGEERISLVKAILSRFAELHDLRVAHRDIGVHSLWVDRSPKVVISGFPAAYYPQMKTVGAFRDKVKVEQSVLPEDSGDSKAATPYRRDVFMLGVLMYLIIYGEKLPKVAGIFEFAPRKVVTFSDALDNVIRQALNREPAERHESARQMLEALNAATANERQYIFDLTAFEAFKTQTKERDYDEIETLVDKDDFHFFRSETEGLPAVVKAWYGIEPDPKKPDLALRLLSFLERARVIKGCGIPGVPRVMDCGLSRRSLLLVLEWVEGKILTDWLRSDPDFEKRMLLALSVTDTLERLHALELAHGDIHPENIIVRTDGAGIFIDILDFHPNADDVYTTAYLPDNYKSLSPFERDRYSLAAVLVEVLGSTRDQPTQGSLPIPRVYEALSELLSAQTLSTLEPLKKALQSAKSKEKEAIPEFSVTVPNLAYEGVPVGELRNDNGIFHVSVQPDRKFARSLRFWVTGIGRQIIFVWRLDEDKAVEVKISSVPQSQLLKSQNLRDAAVKMRVRAVDGPVADIAELAHYLLGIQKLQRKCAQFSATETGTGLDAVGEIGVDAHGKTIARDEVPIRELWQALLDVEEEAFLTVTIAGDKRKSPYHGGQILVPYHMDTGAIDYDKSHKVIVESQAGEGVWKPCGQLNLRDTTFGQLSELAIDQPFLKANFSIGSRLRLVSTLEKGSFTRRRSAVERILNDKAVMPNLASYFEAADAKVLKVTSYPAPSEADLEIYSEGEKKLNDSQKEAFRRVVSNGPISLIQGPPGTGKTWFIACLLHYLMTKERARRILLVSQAHEAVNNALEKGLEMCRSKGLTFDAVRLGAESAASDSIRHLHSASIEQAYRERFKAEQKERMVQLAVALGLPKQFSEEAVELHLRLRRLCEQITKLQVRTGMEDEKAIVSLDARIRALTETFFEIAREVYDYSEERHPADVVRELEQVLIEKFEVHSQDAIERLHKLLRLSEEWLGALGSPDANFAEFLAKSRTVVAGTLVGIGYRGAGVVQNIYDWVIIDEASRAAPSELAVAMQAGHRVLLVGDHHQLPPTFSEEVKAAIKQRFGVGDDSALFGSDFERIFDSKYGRQVGTTLLSQYRMAPDIGELVSICFYDSRLETGRAQPPEYYDLLPEHLSKQVTWLDTTSLGNHGLEQSSEDDEDKWNDAEAHVVMGLLRQLVESEEFMVFLGEDLEPHEPPIGIICMYNKQRERIDQLKVEATWLGDARRLVKVDTVDSYQGKENRIIILSTVRNNRKLSPGFLRSPNRINVAMSRAMERLFIVGASSMWKGRNAGLPLGRVLTKVEQLTAQQRAAFLPADQFLGA